MTKECVGGTESFARPRPDARAADFAARARKSFDGSLGMHSHRRTDLNGAFIDTEKVPHRSDLSKRHASLRHPKRSRIHADEKDCWTHLRSRKKCTVRGPCIFQRVICERHRCPEFHLAALVRKSRCRVLQFCLR